MGLTLGKATRSLSRRVMSAWSEPDGMGQLSLQGREGGRIVSTT
jgi:hypothetical protein